MHYMLENKIGFHSYSLPEDRNLRVVAKGIPKEIAVEDVHEDVRSQGYAIRRLHHPRTKHAMNMAMLEPDLNPKG